MLQTPETLAVSLQAAWIRKYGVSSMSGNCGKIAGLLRDKLEHLGLAGELVNGEFKNFGNHAWIEYAGLILDPSVAQFGPEYPVVSTIHNPDYKKLQSATF